MITVDQIRQSHPYLSRAELEVLVKRLQERGTLEGSPEVPPLREPDEPKPKRRKFWCDYPPDELTIAYGDARREHAFLLRCEGLKLQDIGDRLGVTKGRAEQIISNQARRMRWRLRNVRWTLLDAPAPD